MNDGKARTEHVNIRFTPAEWAALNKLRLAAGREISMSTFIRNTMLEIVADDQAAHDWQQIGDVAQRVVEGLK